VTRTQKPLDEQRDARLLVAAADEFIAHGYQQASLNRIIAAAGVAKSSFYHYFTDKQALYDHLLGTLSRRFAAQRALLDRDALTRETFWDQLDGSMRGLGAAGTDDPIERALARLFHTHSAHDDGLRRLRDDLFEGLGAVLTRGQELGAVRDDLPIDLVVELAAGWLFALDRWAASQADSADGATRRSADLSLRALYEVLAVHA
jgi:AcrR family transcriptional regulator